MQEESNRVLNNMERRREAEINQRRETLQAMKDNDEYTRQAQDRNFQIQQQNLKTELLQSQLDARTAEGQYEQNINQARQIFGGLINLGESAGKISQKIATRNEEKRIAEEYKNSVTGLDTEQSITRRNLELSLSEQSEKYSQFFREREAAGDDPNAIAKGRLADPAKTYMANQSNATWRIKNQFPLYMDAVFNDTETQIEHNGKLVTLSSARSNPELALTLGQTSLVQFLKKAGLYGLSGEMLSDGLKYAEAHINAVSQAASNIETKNIYAMSAEQNFAIALNNPDRFAERGVIIFRSWADNPALGFTGALDNLEKLATARTPDGSGFVHSLDDIGNLDLKGNGRTFKEEWPNRWSAMKEARVNAEMKYTQRQMQIEEIGYAQDSQRILQGLTQDPSQANADAAIKFFRENYGRVPGEVLKFASTYTSEALEKQEAAKRYLAIPSGLITLETVEAAESIDYDMGREMRKRFLEQESRYNSGIFKETAESFKSTANGVTAYGTNKPNTPASIFLQANMRGVFRKRVDQAVAGGMDFNQAATTIGQQLDAEVRAGARDPNSPWYRKVDAPGRAPTFPNLNKGMVSAVEAANRRFSDLKKDIKTNGLERVIGTKGSIITAEEAQEIVQSYGKSGFTIPQDVQAVAGMSNGLDPMVIINRQLVAQGMKPLQPPPSMQSTAQLVAPAFQKLLYKTPSVDRSSRALGSSNTFNATIIPNNLGPVIQQAAQRVGVNPSYIAALAEIESGFNTGSTSYNGSSFGVMQINRAAHPAFFAQQNWKDPQANVNYGAQYYAGLLKKYNDPVAAAMAYNAGPGNYDAYLRGELPDGRVKTEMLNHGKKFAKVMYKYGGSTQALNNPNLMRAGNTNMKLTASATSYVGMDTSDGPDAGRNACVWAVNKVMRAAGLDVPWGNSVYVPFVKNTLDKTARRVPGPVPGAIAIMQDNHPTDPFPHMGIVGGDGMIISNSSSRGRFDWRGTPQEYEQKYGKPNLYYVLN
jgi:hypothetical protein